MKALKIGMLAAAVLGCAAHGEVAMAGKSDDGCRQAYSKVPYFVDGKTKWTYFQDVVADISENDGKTLVAFRQRSKRFELPSDADRSFLAALRASLDKGSPVHVAVDAAGGTSGPKPGGVGDGKLDRIRWASAEKQHDSCR